MVHREHTVHVIVPVSVVTLNPDTGIASIVIVPPSASNVTNVRSKVPYAKSPPVMLIVVTVRAPVAVLVPPEMVSVENVSEFTEPVAVMTTVDVPSVNVPPDESQVPLNVMVDTFAVSSPPAAIVMLPVVMARFDADVVSVVVDAPSLIVSVPPSRNPRVAIVNVCEVPADEVNVTSSNSSSARFAPANVIVPPVAESKRIEPVPASQFASVEAFVHVPLTVHASEPKSIALEADEMFTLPTIVTAPDVLVRSPPDIVRFTSTFSVVVPFAYVPPEMVMLLSTSMFDNAVLVPAS